MLEQYKEIYKQSANLYLSNWEKQNKNQLIREAIEHKDDPKFDSYISAIMLRYWNKMISYYHKCKLVITPEDAHTWLVQAVMYAIERHPWTDEKSSIYNDANGPDKVVNRVIESKRLTFYQQLNRYNRKITSTTMSIEDVQCECADTISPIYYDEYAVENDHLVLQYFDIKEYFYAFLIDAIMYEKYDVNKDIKKLVSHLKSLDDVHCKIFANRYKLNFERVQRASTYVSRLSRFKIKNKIKHSMLDLKKVLSE